MDFCVKHAKIRCKIFVKFSNCTLILTLFQRHCYLRIIFRMTVIYGVFDLQCAIYRDLYFAFVSKNFFLQKA